MRMNSTSRLDPQRYLQNKEYFDRGLIELLEKQTKQISSLRSTVDEDSELKRKYRFEIRSLKLSVKDQSAIVSQLKQNLSSAQEEIQLRDTKINELYSLLNSLYEEIHTISAENEALKKELTLYKTIERKKDSSNTNIPTSYMMFKANANTRVKTGRKRGGQPGHPVHKSKLLKPDRIITMYVDKAPSGAVKDTDLDGNIFFKTQEIDASFHTVVTETHYYVVNGSKALAEDVTMKYRINPIVYSDRFKDSILYLYSKGIIAFDRLTQMVNVLTDGRVTVKPSTVVRWLKEFAISHKRAHDLLLEDLLKQPILGVDETGYKVNGKNAWVHVITDGQRKYYVMTESRSSPDGQLGLLKDYKGILVHDHFKPYYKLKCTHAECNAHILRYLKAGVDFYNNKACEEMIDLLRGALHAVHEAQTDGLDHLPTEEVAFYEDEYNRIISTELILFYKENSNLQKKYIPEYIKTLQRMKEYKNEHLRFLHDFSVWFTNNSERALRMIKVRKKVSGQSANVAIANNLMVMQTLLL